MADIVKQNMRPFNLMRNNKERLTYIFRRLLLANSVVKDGAKCFVMLASCGRPTHNLIQNLLHALPEISADQESSYIIMDKVRYYMIRPFITLSCLIRLRNSILQPDESVKYLLAGDSQDSEQLVQDQLDSALREQLEQSPGNSTIAYILQVAEGNLPMKSFSPILSLPPEVLASIFKLLEVQDKGRVVQVCRTWRDVAELKVVWRDWMVSIPSNRSSPHIYSFLSNRGVHKICLTNKTINKFPGILPHTMLLTTSCLTHLVLSRWTRIRDNTVLQISRTFKELVSLKVYASFDTQITDLSINHICDGLKKLESLTLDLYQNKKVTDAGIEKLATSSLPLRFLALHHCLALTDESIRHLNLGKPSLEGLELGRCSNVTNASIKYITTMTQLRYLKLEHVTFWNSEWEIIATMTSLRTLFLSTLSCDNIDYGIQVLANWSMIDKFALNWGLSITDASLKHVATMPHLRQLSISNCNLITEKGFRHLMRGNKTLTSLKISLCRGISSQQALNCIVANQPNLQWLDLQLFYRMRVRKRMLAMITRRLPRITYLNMNGENLIHKLKHREPQI